MSAHVVTGDGATHAWDQTHALALKRLRHADAFVIFTWDDLLGEVDVMMLAKDGGTPMMLAMLAQAARGLDAACDEVVALCDAEAA